MGVADRRHASEASRTARGAWLPRLSGSLHLTVGLAAVMFVGGLVCGLIVPGPAAADPVPLWSDPITTSAWAAYGAGGREALYVNELQAGMLDTERVIDPDGAIEYKAETGNTTITPPALAADGSGYVLRGGGVAGVIDAIDAAGKVRWSYVVPADDTVRALLAGNDLAAYVIVSNAIDDEVLRLSPVDGSVTFDTPLPDGAYSDGYLFAEPSGVAAVTGTHVLFLSEQGQVTADVPAFSSGSATVFTSNNVGDVFVGAAPVLGSEVNLTNGLAVSKATPSGQVEWTIQTPATGEELGSMVLAALPDGGVAYEVAGQSVGVLNADGTTRWSTKNPLGYGAMLADSADHLDFERVLSNQSCSDTVANCDGFAVDQLDASDGQVQRSVSLIPSEDPSRFWFCGGFSLGPGLFYVLDRLAPADGETCGGGVTQPQLQAFALPDTTGPYPLPPATTIPPTTGPTGGGPGGGGVGSGATHKLPIVLIPGIQSKTTLTTPATPWTRETRCPEKEPFKTMCSTLRAKGYPVYVVDASVGPDPKVTLDSEGDIKTNASKLVTFLDKYVHGRALLVGHSMGGLIARVALKRYQAAGLFTIGTPYEGSYVADVGEVVNDVICLALKASPALSAAKLSCSTIEAALHQGIAFGSTAARELTHVEREKEAATLAPPSVPLWTIAGTGVPVPQMLSGLLPSSDLGYFFPNDILVGESSAWGINAHLGVTCAGAALGVELSCDHRIAVPAFHFGGPFGSSVLSPAETNNPTIIADVQDVAQRLENHGAVAAATVVSTHDPASLSSPNATGSVRSTAVAASRRARHRPAARPHTQRFALVAIGGSTTSRSQAVQVASHGFVLSDRAFQVSCDGRTWEAVPIAPGVWAAFGAPVTCSAVAQLAAGSEYLTAVERPRTSIRALGTTRGSLLTVRIVGPGTLKATLSLAGRRPLRLARRRGGYEITAHMGRHGPVILTIVGGREVLRGVLRP